MEIIQTELRLKDIEWVEKSLDNLKKTGRNLGSSSLADKAKKEEIVRLCLIDPCYFTDIETQAVIEKVLKTLTVDSKDIRKAEWNNKEVGIFRVSVYCVTKKSFVLDNPALRGGSNAPHNL